MRKRVTLSGVFIPVFVLLLFMHDYVFLMIEYKFGSTYGLNLWKEIVAILYLAIMLLTIIYSGKVSRSSFKLLLFLGLLLVFLVVDGAYSEAAFRTLRTLFTPFVLAVLMASMLTINFDLRYRILMAALQLVTITFCVFGLYQLFNYSTWSDFWYVEPLTSMGFELKEYNAIRDGLPRISSFFTSSLEFGFFLVFVFFINFSRLVFLRSSSRYSGLSTLIRLGWLCIIVYLLFNSTVRSAQMCWFAGMIYVVILMLLRQALLVFLSGLLFVVSMCLATFLFIGLGYTDDPSALGRLVQWRLVFDLVMSQPLGLGFSAIGPAQAYWFDSFWLNLATGFGLMSLPIFVIFLFGYRAIVYRYKDVSVLMGGELKSLYYSLLVLFPIFLYAAFFQAFYNSTVFYLFITMVFAAFVGGKNVRN
ncbi:hypothetical protein D3C77_265240 [compost metagenome]